MPGEQVNKESLLDKDEEKKTNVYYCFAAVVDIMGLSEKFQELGEIPSDPDEQELYIKAIELALGPVDEMRSFYKKLCDRVSSFKHSFIKDIPVNSEELLNHNLEICPTVISDTVLLSGALLDKNNFGILAIYQLFRTLSMGMFYLLSQQIVTRSAVCINVGINRRGGEELTGPAIAQVFKMESREVHWPRIIIHRSVLEYIDHVNNYPYQNLKWGNVAKAVANQCRSFIVLDEDDANGNFILDYMGKHSRSTMYPDLAADFGKIYPQVLQFVTESKLSFVQTDAKVFQYYAKLEKYLTRRKDIWTNE